MSIKFEDSKFVVTLPPEQSKGKIRKWQKNPGDLNLAAAAAFQTAKKLSEDIYVIPGNSYMQKVYHLARQNDSIVKYTAMKTTIKALRVTPEGNVYRGNAS